MNIDLTLFFTAGISLDTWHTIGILERETALYQRLQAQGVQVSFVTYGDSRDVPYRYRIPGVRILCNRWGLPAGIYRRFLPVLHAPYLMRSHIYKTNQTNGAMAAVRCAQLWRKPLIVRCGYMWSDFAVRRGSTAPEALARVRSQEERAFQAASHVVVTTAAMADDVSRRVPGVRGRMSVIPNYVDLQRFPPRRDDVHPEFDIIFIGRMAEQKNVGALLEAVGQLDVKLLLVGSGELPDELQQGCDAVQGKITRLRNVPHSEISALLQRARIFVLPSHYEGHPKALIEAMACGLPVICADSPGMRELIVHGENGLLCGSAVRELRETITLLLGDKELQKKLGANACRQITRSYSLDSIVDMELKLIRKVSGR